MAPVLGYWKYRGLGQPIKLLLAHANVEYEDKRYVMGPAPDYDRSMWLDEKFNLGLELPNLPYYIDGDVKITQFIAIMKYLGRKHGLDATNEEETLRVDMVDGLGNDMILHLGMLCYNPDFENAKEEYIKNLPNVLKQCSSFLGSRKWFAGERMTFVDFLMYEILDVLEIFQPKCLDDFSNLCDYVKRFESLPNIAAYMKSDKFIKYPIVSPTAAWGGK